MPGYPSSLAFVYALVTGTSGSHQRIKAADVLALPAPRLSADEMERFGSIADPLLSRMLHNVRESEKLAELRDRLLPKLISGDLRIRDAEALVEDRL
jgi:type I restriction enzyme S subunit